MQIPPSRIVPKTCMRGYYYIPSIFKNLFTAYISQAELPRSDSTDLNQVSLLGN